MKYFIKIMKALADPTRVKIIKALQHKQMCVCELTEALGVAQSTVSSHLNKLETAGLVARQKDGLWVNYWLETDSDNPYARQMLELIKDLLEDDTDIATLLKRLPDIHRDHICRR